MDCAGMVMVCHSLEPKVQAESLSCFHPNRKCGSCMTPGSTWPAEYSYDFDRQAADVRELRGMGLKQSTIGTVVGLSQGQVSKILSLGF